MEHTVTSWQIVKTNELTTKETLGLQSHIGVGQTGSVVALSGAEAQMLMST